MAAEEQQRILKIVTLQELSGGKLPPNEPLFSIDGKIVAYYRPTPGIAPSLGEKIVAPDDGTTE